MSRIKWNIDKVKQGFELFIKKNGRPPHWQEINRQNGLPTPRTLQRQFGGLEQIRRQFNLEITHFGRGPFRSQAATKLNQRAKFVETRVRTILVEKFGPMFVHIERPFAISSKQRLDFFVFSPDNNFGVDVFYPKDEHSMSGCIIAKARTYSEYKDLLFLIMANENIGQETIDRVTGNKHNQLANNFKIVTLSNFLASIAPMKAYTIIEGGA